MKFTEMNLPEFIINGLDQNQISIATDVQEKCIPPIREGHDIVGISKTGSGKTFAYAIPAVELITEEQSTQVLIICPTRELAAQVCDEMRKITSHRDGCRVVPILGGSHMDRQIMLLKKGARIVVGTPGRIMDHLRRRTLRLDHLKLAVLDEADEMMDMGFKDDMHEILSKANPDRQTIMFSATMPAEVLRLTKEFMRDSITIDCVDHEAAQSFISQYYVSIDKSDKMAGAEQLIRELNPTRAIVFCNTKSMVDELSEHLSRSNISAVGLHGDMRQNERRTAMNAIKNSSCAVLVATDVAARGIDLKDVDFVLNYDIPNDFDYYIHRIGRTARAGKAGSAYTIVCGRGNLNVLNMLIKETGNEILEHTFSLTVPVSSKRKSAPADRKEVFKKGKEYVRSADSKWKKDDNTEKPRNDWKPDWKTDKPKSDWKTDKPKTDWKTDKPKSDWKTDKPKSDWKTDKPKSDWKTDKPKSDWKTDKPKSDWKTDKPKSDWKTDKPKSDWKTDKPKSDWKTDKPKSDWKTDKPKSDWKTDKPKSDWKTDKPKSDWKTDKPKSDWKTDKPKSEKPKSDYYANLPKKTRDSSKPKNHNHKPNPPKAPQQ